MKIWIDLTNSPHVLFFAGLIKELQLSHEILLTCRPLSNTIELMDLHNLSYHRVGGHYGANIVKKAIGFPLRIIQLYLFLRDKNIDVAISHSSFYSPLVSKLLGSRCIYINDNEHAAGNRISFIFADQIMIPEFLDIDKVKNQGAKEHKIKKYPGLKESVYLWNYQPSPSNASRFNIDKQKRNIFIRPEPWTAQYYRGKRNFIDDLIIELKISFNVVLLPRNKDQEEYYRQEKFSGLHIPAKSVSLSDIMENCDLFIGAGGTMTREAAVLGIPTISIYQESPLDVDQFLIKSGCMVHKKDLDAGFAVKYLREKGRKPPDSSLLQKGKEAYELIRSSLLGGAAWKAASL